MNAQRDTDAPVFLDRSGRRARHVRIAAACVAAASLLLLTGFGVSLALRPQLAPLSPNAEALHRFPMQHRFLSARRELFRRIARDAAAAHGRIPAPANSQISGAYFAPWVEGGLDAFRAHASSLTHVYPAWLQLNADGRSIRTADWDPRTSRTTAPLMRIAQAQGVKVVPTLSNAYNFHFDSRRVARMLNTPGAGDQVIAQIVSFVNDNRLAGIQLDIEFIDRALQPQYEAWVHSLAHALHASGKEFSVALQASEDEDIIRDLAEPADYVVAMAYDEHDTPNVPAPVASATFVETVLNRFASAIPPQKLVLGVGVYGYDWAMNGSEPQTVTNAEALALAAGYRDQEHAQDVIDFDEGALEPTFDYADDQNVNHEVWFLDGATVANAMRMANLHRARGATLWAIGMEDPTSWRVFGKNVQPNADLHALPPPTAPEFIGDGELLNVRRPPSAGLRSYEYDPHTGLINDENYLAYPTSWVVERRGDAANEVALTFDDGPDPNWTPRILDILKRHRIHATFFMIGENVVSHPDLVRRVYAEGNEIGNHSFTHPNMAHVGPDRVRLELTACQRAIESLIGRSTRLFRPPFNADADPASYGELMPVQVASEEGYVTAGESVDPQDWQLDVRDPDGSAHRLTAQEIAGSAMSQLSRGHAILLHDGGGDRSATVDAVEILISTLEARGYRFVTMGELAGMQTQATMPALSPADRQMAALDDAAFSVERTISTILFWAFSIAIVLGLTRIALMLSLSAFRTQRPEIIPGPPPRIDTLIAAYNEEAVIVATIASVLASRDVDVRVILVDDGSTDGTAAAVAQAFPNEPRLSVISKPNGGKASALNLALANADAPVVVGIDADTQVAPDALAALARRFADPSIAAIAGNVRVGNRNNFVTRWQAVEYITSQNIDRRALARVNAVTVVPGAIGAWRASALRAVEGYKSDTLAEDMDLTWRLRRAGWRIGNEARAIAYTEAPASLSGLMKQRFRWTFGTLQCLWKHRGALFRYGWFGAYALPSLWLFQIVLQVLAPFIDLQLLVAIVGRTFAWIESLQHADIAPPSDPAVWFIIGIYVAFLALELAAAWVAFALDREDKRLLWLQPLQRLVYRQIMYLAVWRAMLRAVAGASQAWGKLRRTGSVRPVVTSANEEAMG